jgi:deoxyuridine 5''-triphosphate nucleotidohydrolase (dut)
MNRLKIQLDPGAFRPERAHSDDAGLDLRSPMDVIVKPHSSVEIDTGVHVAIPRGFVGMIRSKSGLMVNHEITTDGTIDAGYNGSIHVKLFNHGDWHYTIRRGDKVTQLVISPIITPEIELVSALEETERGANGFGSTGI